MKVKDFPVNKWDKPSNLVYEGHWVFNWFSNMIPCPFPLIQEFKGEVLSFASVEHFYQGNKTLVLEERKLFTNPSLKPGKAKRLSRSLTIREDWELVQVQVMKEALQLKWTQEPFKTQLLKSEGSIIEFNNWRDKDWGVCITSLEGRNILGILLEEVREEL